MERPRLPISVEGWPFILAPALLAEILALGGLVGWGLLAFALACFVAYFFRDPERVFSGDEGDLAAPADGEIVFVGQVEAAPISGRPALKVSIFMSLFDCHVNRSPADGRVKELKYYPGRFFNASWNKASVENERLVMAIETPNGEEVEVAQIAGMIARRIVCRAREGDELVAGQRYGLIRFGSRLDLYLPPASRVVVVPGQRVKAGQTLLGELG
ncbi:MAG: phosphatidylserine decarboxylase family protein [Deltaproteobacteria bacterium]|nr:phosphatidylserine decarboxylase family protein [Deltaproteobacteria bacterium]